MLFYNPFAGIMKDPIKTFEYKGKESAWPFCHLEGFGLELDGVDLKKVTADEIDFIKHTLARESMIIFKNQALDDADLLAFAERVGNGKLEPSASKINHGRRIKEIGYITNLMDGEGQPLGFYKNTTDFWHSDQEFREHPASIGILFCLIPPERGGETSFASTSAELFSEEELAVIRSLLGSRVPADFHDNIKHQMVAHPVVVTNPQTHRSYVYVSENTIDLLDQELRVQAKRKEDLLETILHPSNIYRHYWKSGDMILYDNTQLLHRREAYEGIRFLKALKIYPDSTFHTKIEGRVIF